MPTAFLFSEYTMNDYDIITLSQPGPCKDNGSGGLKFDAPSDCLYNDSAILHEFHGIYVHSVGPFKNWVTMGATVKTMDWTYHIGFKKEFRGQINEVYMIREFMYPFLEMLRSVVEGGQNPYKIKKEGYYDCGRVATSAEDKKWMPLWLEQAGKNTPFR